MKPPDGRLRQSQVVTSFGPGALLDLIGDAVIVGGLDYWGFGESGVMVREPRLLEAIEPMFQKKKWRLSKDSPFRKPPAGDERAFSELNGVQVYEFPRWFVCQNPRCRALVKAGGLERTNQEYRHRCAGSDKAARCVPIRFVGACRRGHIDDLDWTFWSHTKGKCASAQLRLVEGPTGDFSDIAVSCVCGQSRRLIELMVEDKQPKCSGRRPWLGDDAGESCTERQRLLVRTASNGYFAQTTSVLTIPEPESLRRRVKSVWDVLGAATAQTLPPFRTIEKVGKALGSATDADVLAAIDAERHQTTEVMPLIRTAEWQTFLSQPAEKPGEMPTDRTEPFWARRAPRLSGLPPQVAQVVTARRLREVQAQLGFTRLEPLSSDLQGRYDLDVDLAPLSLQQSWVPVTEMLGEGLLVVLDEASVHAWEQRSAVKKRTEDLHAAWERWKSRSKSKLPFPGARLYLLHTLAHVLMTELSLECGYPASAIRERIYCDGHDAPTPMAGVLLLTGTSGTEGTLGGLVDEGQRLDRHLARALESARLCSNDPVCSHHEPSGLGDRNLEGAACHACLFVPECSCERFNQYLDRALLVPTLKDDGAAFFNS